MSGVGALLGPVLSLDDGFLDSGPSLSHTFGFHGSLSLLTERTSAKELSEGYAIEGSLLVKSRHRRFTPPLPP